MKRIFLICIISLSLFAQNTAFIGNPKVYSVLGDEIYNNISNIKKLKKIDKYSSFIPKIDGYITMVAEAKKFGFMIESGQKANEKKHYLNTLRKLAKENSYFLRSAESTLKSAIDTKNNKLFLSIINSGMINIKKNSKRIFSYYNKNSDKIVVSGALQSFIDKEYSKRSKKYTKKKRSLKNEDKIKRIRELEKYKQKLLEKKLSDEVAQKKQKILEEQQRELIR